MIKTIIVDYDDLNNIKNAERLYTRLQNRGFNTIKTEQIGFNRFKITMEGI